MNSSKEDLMQWIFAQMGEEGHRRVRDMIHSVEFKTRWPERMFQAFLELSNGQVKPFDFMFYYESQRRGLSTTLFGTYRDPLFCVHRWHVPSRFTLLHFMFNLF